MAENHATHQLHIYILHFTNALPEKARHVSPSPWFYEHLINMLQNVEHIANNTFNLSFINI